MKKNLIKNCVATLAFMLTLFISNTTFAQTSVYYCSDTGAYGYCYGGTDIGTCAKNKCKSHGGTRPLSILFEYSKGYGAIAIGTNSNGVRVIGAAAGYGSSHDAQERAKKECKSRGGKNPYIAKTFHDN